MKRTLFSLCLVFCCVVQMFAGGEWKRAYDFEVDHIYYKIINETSVSVIYPRGDAGDYSDYGYKNDYAGVIVIPENVSYNGQTFIVTAIAKYTFDNADITAITIPNSVTSIGEGAFYNCSGLTSVTIPNSVTSIAERVFYGCSGLTSITIPNSVTSIGDDAFYGCSGLTSVTVPNSVTSIGRDAFYYCRNLTSVTIPNSITSMGNSVFRECNSLKEVTWNAITCQDLSSGDNSPFANLSSITSFTFGAEVVRIPAYLCNGCSGLTSITIPQSVTTIGGYAFRGCNGLTSVFIPKSVRTITPTLFYGCKNLTSLIVEDNNRVYVSNGNCIIAKLTKMLVVGCTGSTIPDDGSVTSIGSSAFSGSGLTSITIPNSITSIGDNAFSDCSKLTSVTIPNSITRIEDYTFASCKSLTSITIPNSVTSIGGYVFSYCSDLTSVTIPNSVTSIGGAAFALCSGLTSITIPNSVTSIGWGAFSECTKLTKTNYTGDIASWCNISFGGEKGNPIKYSNNLYINNIEIKDLVIPAGVTNIGNYTFSSCSGLTLVDIPNSVTSIGEYAFHECTNLKSVRIHSTTPPREYSGVFPTTATIVVPCGTLEAYWNDAEWVKYPLYDEEFLTDWNAVSEDETHGTVLIAKSPTSCNDNTATFAAIPASGYKFRQWNDGNTDNPRTVAITEEITYTAYFFNENNVDGVSLDEHYVSLSTGDTYPLHATITPATAQNKNVTWYSDNEYVASVDAQGVVTANHRGTANIYVTTEDGNFTDMCYVNVSTAFTALALPIKHLTLHLDEAYFLNVHVEPYDANKNELYWSSSEYYVASVENGLVRAAYWTGNATIMVSTPDGKLSASCEVNVVNPGDYISTDVVINPSSESVDLSWAKNDNASQYIFMIYANAEQTEKICTLTFDANGYLTRIDFLRHAPAATRDAQRGFNFVVTGLTPNTTYGYTLDSYTDESQLLERKAGQFTTTSEETTGLTHEADNVDTSTRKVFENGTIYIFRQGEKYTLDGRRVK